MPRRNPTYPDQMGKSNQPYARFVYVEYHSHHQLQLRRWGHKLLMSCVSSTDRNGSTRCLWRMAWKRRGVQARCEFFKVLSSAGDLKPDSATRIIPRNRPQGTRSQSQRWKCRVCWVRVLYFISSWAIGANSTNRSLGSISILYRWHATLR